jgi:hypothetical protein
MSRYYVYALIDPDSGCPRYIGKGLANRTEQHLREAVATLTIGVKAEEVWANDEATTPANATSKRDWLQGLLGRGFSHADIARVIARDLDEPTAFTLESLLITHVYGYGNGSLLNVQPGHHAGRFRPYGNWGETDSSNKNDGTREPGYYVYVLRDPQDHRDNRDGVFYVGKGRGNRLDTHFMEANRLNGEPEDPERLRRVRELIERGLAWKDIGQVVAHVATEMEAFRIEALLIKFVYGLAGLTNLVAGHHVCTIRPKDHWLPLPGFDLPRVLDPGARQDRSEMLQLLLAEGLARPLDWIRQELVGTLQFGEYKVLDSGELGMEAPCGGTTLKVFTRRKKIQLELRPRTRAQRLWMRQRMEALAAAHLLRGDQVFIPPTWRGARQMTDSAQEAATRATLLSELTGARPRGQLSPAVRLLLVVLAQQPGVHADDDEPDVPVAETTVAPPSPHSAGGGAAAPLPPIADAPADNEPTAHADTLREPLPPRPQEGGGANAPALPPASAVPGVNDCILLLQGIADQFPDIEFDQPRPRDAGEISIEGLLGAEGEELGAILKISCRRSGIGLELRGRTKGTKAWLLARLRLLGCTLERAMNPKEVVFLPAPWRGHEGMARTLDMVALRVSQLLQIVTTTDPDDLDDEVRHLLHP